MISREQVPVGQIVNEKYLIRNTTCISHKGYGMMYL